MSTAGDQTRLNTEEAFHDEWAESTDISGIDVVLANEACTVPEMRWLVAELGDLKGKKVLDVGCGLGEASVYFALKGATVTATDLSSGMLGVTQRLAEKNGVHVEVHQSNAETVGFGPEVLFDVIYVGNLFHHVDIAKTLADLKRHLAPGGMLVSWDPVAYNPLINIYRAIATKVRTPDEHPLTQKDIALFRQHFGQVKTRFFWLTTLSIFLIMAGVLFRNPNKVRYWKKVVEEEARWRPIYLPLEALDRALLRVVPPLKYFCWNVAIVSRNPL